jgi:hypothetical protein
MLKTSIEMSPTGQDILWPGDCLLLTLADISQLTVAQISVCFSIYSPSFFIWMQINISDVTHIGLLNKWIYTVTIHLNRCDWNFLSVLYSYSRIAAIQFSSFPFLVFQAYTQSNVCMLYECRGKRYNSLETTISRLILVLITLTYI